MDTNILTGQRGGVTIGFVTGLSAFKAQLCPSLLQLKPLRALVFPVIK